MVRVTAAEIEAAMTKKGGWTRETLAGWGVSWPPPKGWRDKLIAGEALPAPDRDTIEPSPIRPSIPAHDLLRMVVLAVIDKGHASDLYDFPDVLEYFGAKNPDDPDAAYGPATREFFAPKGH